MKSPMETIKKAYHNSELNQHDFENFSSFVHKWNNRNPDKTIAYLVDWVAKGKYKITILEKLEKE
jgi:hypothetical protein